MISLTFVFLIGLTVLAFFGVLFLPMIPDLAITHSSWIISNEATVGFSLIILIFGFLWGINILRKSRQIRKIIADILHSMPENFQGSDEEKNFEEKYLEDQDIRKLVDRYKKQIQVFFLENTNGEKEGKLVSYQLAENFFNNESIVEPNFNIEYYRSIPGILTGLGIFFTFIGLAGGIYLSSADLFDGQKHMKDLNDLSPLTKPLFDLLGGAAQAFVTSICGLLCSMIVSYIFHDSHDSVQRDLQTLVDTLNKRFPPTPSEAFLNRQLAVSEEHLKDVKILVENWMGWMGNLFKDMTKNYSDENQKQTEAMLAALQKIENGITSMSKNQGEQVGEAITQAAIKMGEELNKQIEKMTASFTDSSVAVKASVEALDSMLGHVNETIDNTSRQLLNNVHELQKTVTESNESFTKEIDAMSNKLLEARQSLDKVGEEFTVLAGNVKTASAELKDAGDATATSLTGSAESAGENFKNSSRESGRLFGENVSAVGDKLKTDFAEISDTMMDASSQIKESAKAIADNLEKAAIAAAADIKSAGKGAGEDVKGKAEDALKGFGLELATIAATMSKASEQMKEAGDTVAATLVKSAEDAGTTFKDSTEESGKIFGVALSDAGEVLRGQMAKTGADLVESSGKIQTAADKMEAGINRSGEILAEGAKEAGKEFQTAIKKASDDFTGDVRGVLDATDTLVSNADRVSRSLVNTMEVLDGKIKLLGEAEKRSSELAESYGSIARILQAAADKIGAKIDKLDVTTATQNKTNLELNEQALKLLKDVIVRVQTVGQLQTQVATDAENLQKIVCSQMTTMAENLKAMNDEMRDNIAAADTDLSNALGRLTEALADWIKRTDSQNKVSKRQFEELSVLQKNLEEQQKWVHDSVKLLINKQRKDL